MKARLGLEAGLVWYQPSDFRTPEHHWNLKATAEKREKHQKNMGINFRLFNPNDSCCFFGDPRAAPRNAPSLTCQAGPGGLTSLLGVKGYHKQKELRMSCAKSQNMKLTYVCI